MRSLGGAENYYRGKLHTTEAAGVYLARHPDVAKAVRVGELTAWQHYTRYGYSEGREWPSHVSDSYVRIAGKQGGAPTISIVIPLYQAEKFIENTLSSILGQTFQDFEIILVDDGSTDHSLEIAATVLAKSCKNYTIFAKENGGTGSALNLGFKFARGQFQTWWSADSWVTSEWLEVLYNTLLQDSSVGFVYSNWYQHEDSTGENTLMEAGEYDPERLKQLCYVGVCWLWRKSVKDAVGEFLTKPCEDYDMHLRMSEVTAFRKVPKALGFWRNHPLNVTNRICRAEDWAPSCRIRYAHNWRSKKLKVLNVAPWWDAASVGWQLSDLMNSLSQRVASRHVLGERTSMFQVEDLYHDDTTEIGRLFKEADVLHFNMVTPDYEKNRIDVTPWLESGKPTIFHLHGGPWQWNRRKVIELREKYPMAVVSCNPRINELIPRAFWVPNPIPIGPEEALWEKCHYTPPSGWPNLGDPISYFFGHNYRVGKGFETIKEIEAELGNLKANFRLSLMEGPPEKMRVFINAKKQYDGVIDQLTQGFIGMAGWESLAQGAVVFARLDEAAIREYTKLGQGTPPPIVNCHGTDFLVNNLLDLADNRQQFIDLKVQSFEWANEHYSARRLVSLWDGIYEKVHARSYSL